jgi:hypothetical protein
MDREDERMSTELFGAKSGQLDEVLSCGGIDGGAGK